MNLQLLRVAMVALVLVAGYSVWHSYQDHHAHHQMVRFWNQYGPLLEQARKEIVAKERPVR